MRYKNIIFVVLTLWIARVSFSQTISIGVDASAGKTAISPYIFGANVSLSEDSTNPTPASTWQMYRDVGLNMFRDCGGNNATKYNWRLKLTCHPDWYKNVYGENWD